MELSRRILEQLFTECDESTLKIIWLGGEQLPRDGNRRPLPLLEARVMRGTLLCDLDHGLLKMVRRKSLLV